MSQIEEFASQGIYIEILADAFKIEGCSVCWRAYVHWKEEEWEEADLGCYHKYQKAVDVAFEFAEQLPSSMIWRRSQKTERTAWEDFTFPAQIIMSLIVFPALIGFSVFVGFLFVKLAIMFF